LRHKSGDVYRKDRMLDSKTFLHKVGDDPSHDREIFSRAINNDLIIDPGEIPDVKYDRNCNFIFGYLATADNRLKVYYAPYSELKKEKIMWKRLFKPDDEIYDFIPTKKDIYLYTPKNAPNFKILKTSLFNPDPDFAEIVVQEDPDRKLTSFALTCDGLFYTLSENGIKEELYFLPNGEKSGQEIDLPLAAGTVNLMAKGINFSDIWVTITGWTSDFQRYRYSAQNKEFLPEDLSSSPQYPECEDLIVEELMVPSYDGIKVPLSLVYKKGIKKNGKNPVLMYGYGAYGLSSTPSFDISNLPWTSNDGIIAIAHVRGGGELGDQWHKAGYKTTKPNTWKDLIACAEYLINEKYTSQGKIVINSTSAGGILVGRALTERPDLFAAAIPVAGLLNTLRLEEIPNGSVHAIEFGTVKDSIECMALIEMDSYLQIKDGVKYPATLILAGMNDPRVPVWQPAKFAARLQAANASGKPVLILVDYEAGHGAGGTKAKIYEEAADILSFAFWQTGHPDYQIE
ncbi:MAG: prolyl oligopeptidase family serine peptidase, partial [Bacteroidales bacterium]|nr:prolyl oligopeptidase family serine peptidase [Bacteroidales bacterium]